MLRAGGKRPPKECTSWPLRRDEIPFIKFTLIKLMIIELKISFSVGIGLWQRKEHLSKGAQERGG
jgi:hypothetical protein